MSTINLKLQLENLVSLQKVDFEIHTLNIEKDSKPQEIKAIELAFEAKKQHLAELEKNVLDLQKLRKERELELATKEEATKKLQSQLFSLKTNKEYQTMLSQIEGSKADASLIEDKILEVFEQADKVRVEMEKEKEKIKEEEKVFLGQKKTVEMRVKEIDDRMAQLDAQRKQVLPSIDPKIYLQYERILNSRDGRAIVKVEHNICGGCNLLVPPQVINLISMYDKLVTCENCNRILYTEG